MEETPIRNFYKDTNVFITGGTGFLGKLLIEKLLRSTEVNSIYVLVREKRGLDKDVRIENLFDDVVFKRLKEEKPTFRFKIKAISGDCSLPGLGLTIPDRQTLISKINIIFHGAATVKFNEHLRTAYNINVNGTKQVLELAKQMMNLKSMVHVSTAFSHCPREKIEEKIYDCPISYENVERMIEKCDDDEIDRIIGKWPNTYTFTKALAESLFRDIGIPSAIFRPSAIISTYKEPLEGWTDNLYGPCGVFFAVMVGMLRLIICDTGRYAEQVPADTCVAALIATAWNVSMENGKSSEVSVYNYVSSAENPITWREFSDLNKANYDEYPTGKSLWSPKLIRTKNWTFFWFLHFFLHTIPGLIMDCGMVVMGKKPCFSKKYQKLLEFINTLSYFTMREWKFSNKNTMDLWRKLTNQDKEIFPMSVTTVQWIPYSKSFIKGIRKYLLKDPDATVDAARNRDTWLCFLDKAFKCGAIILLSQLVMKMTICQILA